MTGDGPCPGAQVGGASSRTRFEEDGGTSGELLGLDPRDVDLGIDMDGTAAELDGSGYPRDRFPVLTSLDPGLEGHGVRDSGQEFVGLFFGRETAGRGQSLDEPFVAQRSRVRMAEF